MENDKIGTEERAWLNGGVWGDNRIPDDAKKLHLTVIGTEIDRKRVLDDISGNPALRESVDGLIVKDYPPEHWHVKDAGFAVEGKPAIYLQTPDGKVLHHGLDYPGPEKLAMAVSGARRKADPSYDSKRDTDLLRPRFQAPTWWGLAASGAGIVLLYLWKQRGGR